MSVHPNQQIHSDNHASNDRPKEPSIMTQDEGDELHPDFDLFSETYPKQYFFYGSLMEPKMLVNLLGLTADPELRTALVVGYKTMMWGPFPALIHKSGESVMGVVYSVQSAEGEANLQRYESTNYAPTSCEMEFEDGTRTSGSTFLWVGDQNDLEEGEYDFEAWQAEEWGEEEEEEDGGPPTVGACSTES